MDKPDPERTSDELPELGEDFFARAKPAAEVMGKAFMDRARMHGRPNPQHWKSR